MNTGNKNRISTYSAVMRSYYGPVVSCEALTIHNWKIHNVQCTIAVVSQLSREIHFVIVDLKIACSLQHDIPKYI